MSVVLAAHPLALTLEVLAVITSACYGILLARRNGFDLVGIYTLALLIAFGGGTLRDLFLDRHPLFWVANPSYPFLVFWLALASTRIRELGRIFPSWLEGFDALALGLYTASGVQAGLAAGTDWFVACLLGVIAGCFGGVTADLMTGQVPRLFRGRTPIYATASMLGGALMVAATVLNLPPPWPAVFGVVAVSVIRLLALRYDWHLPEVHDPDQGIDDGVQERTDERTAAAEPDPPRVPNATDQTPSADSSTH